MVVDTPSLRLFFDGVFFLQVRNVGSGAAVHAGSGDDVQTDQTG